MSYQNLAAITPLCRRFGDAFEDVWRMTDTTVIDIEVPGDLKPAQVRLSRWPNSHVCNSSAKGTKPITISFSKTFDDPSNCNKNFLRLNTSV